MNYDPSFLFYSNANFLLIFQLDIDAGVPARSSAVQLQEEMGEGEMEMEVETCLPCLPHHLDFLQGRVSSSSLFSLRPIFFQAALLLNPSPRMMGMNIRMTACEATLESLLQLSLQLFIIFLRSDTIPSLLQVGWLERGSLIAKGLCYRSSPSSPLCSWCLWVRPKTLSSQRQTRK